MNGWRGALISGLAIYVAAAFQQALGAATLLGGRFDFVLTVLSVLCLFASRRGGTVIGFFCGWLIGALVGANLWQYVLSRTLGGFLMSWLASTGIERSYFSAALAGAAGVFLCQLSFMFFAPPSSITGFLGDTIRTAVYNGVLATLVYAGLNRVLGPRL